MRAKIIAVPAGIALLALVGAAMFHSEAASRVTAIPSTIEPGQAAPHEDRGICTACHLLGGPSVKPTFGVTAPPTGFATTAITPAIRIDQIRPHAERGSCVNCHTILPATQVTAAGDQLAQMSGATMLAMPMQPAYGYPGAAWAGPGANPFAFAGPNGAGPVPPGGNWSPGVGVAPPIMAGTPPPHGWRGDCMTCHSISQPNAWTPTPPLARPDTTPQTRGPLETEALGMSLRPTNGDVKGMMVVEVEGMARKAGLKLGDIVRAVDGQLIADVASFKAAVRTADPARGVVVDLVRDGQAQALVIQ